MLSFLNWTRRNRNECLIHIHSPLFYQFRWAFFGVGWVGVLYSGLQRPGGFIHSFVHSLIHAIFPGHELWPGCGVTEVAVIRSPWEIPGDGMGSKRRRTVEKCDLRLRGLREPSRKGPAGLRGFPALWPRGTAGSQESGQTHTLRVRGHWDGTAEGQTCPP